MDKDRRRPIVDAFDKLMEELPNDYTGEYALRMIFKTGNVSGKMRETKDRPFSNYCRNPDIFRNIEGNG